MASGQSFMPGSLPQTGGTTGLATVPSGQVNAQPAYLPTPAQGQATYYGGTTDPTQSIQLLLNAFQPAAQQQYQNAMDTAAFSGVQGGPLDTISRELAQAQTSAISPALQQALQFAQGQQQQAGLFNTNAANQFTSENLQNLLGQQQYNTGTYNQSLQNLMNMFANPYQQMQGYGSQLALGNAQNFQIPQSGGGIQNLMAGLGGGMNFNPSGGYSNAEIYNPGTFGSDQYNQQQTYGPGLQSLMNPQYSY